MKKIVSLLLLVGALFADSVYVKQFDSVMADVEKKIRTIFPQNKLMVVSDVNILEKFKEAGLPKKFGENFNTNELTGIKALIVCNGWFGNEVANSDPDMMGFCPVRITMVEKDGKTSVIYVKTSAPESSKAYAVLQKLDTKIISTIESVR